MNRKAYRRGVLGTLAQIALLLVALTPNSVAQAAQEERAGIPKTDKQRLAEAYGKIPLNFERNTGQTSNEVEFLSRGPGYTLFLTRHARPSWCWFGDHPACLGIADGPSRGRRPTSNGIYTAVGLPNEVCKCPSDSTS